MKVTWIDDRTYELLKKNIDPKATWNANNNELEIIFPDNFIQVDDVIELEDPKIINYIKNYLTDEQTEYANQKASPKLLPNNEEQLLYDWLTINSHNKNADDLIKNTIQHFANNYGATHLLITRLDINKIELLHRLPRIAYFKEKHPENWKKYMEDNSGDFLLPSTFDLMNYILIFLFMDKTSLSIPIHALTSGFTIHFLNSDLFHFPYWEERGYKRFFNEVRPATQYNLFATLSPKSVEEKSCLFKSCTSILNNILTYIYDWKNWTTEEGSVAFENNIKSITQLRYIIESILHTNTMQHREFRTASTFRTLDLISNFIHSLIKCKDKKKALKEEDIFSKLFQYRNFPKSDNIFNNINYFKNLHQCVDDTIASFSSDTNVCRDFRNQYAHGTYSNQKKDRFEKLIICKDLPPEEIYFLPIIWIAILGTNLPEAIEYLSS